MSQTLLKSNIGASLLKLLKQTAVFAAATFIFFSASSGQDSAVKGNLPIVLQEHEVGRLRSQIDKQVVVQGRVASTSSSGSGHQFLNFPSGSVRVICFKDDLKNFSKGGPAALYKGKSIALTGLLQQHKGNLQIQLKSPKQISIAGEMSGKSGSKPFALKEISPGVFVSPAGLRYAGRDPEGRTRVEHVMRHARNEPGRAGSHGVFEKGSQSDVLELIDEAWILAKKKGIKPKREGNSMAYTIPMGRRIGYLGGREGTRLRKPILTRLLIVVRRDSSGVITAFPK